MLGSLAVLLNSSGLRVAVYLASAAVCTFAGIEERRLSSNGRSRRAGFWLMLAGLLLLLGIGRDIDLGPRITGVGRDYARGHDLYAERRPLQEAAVVVIAAVGAVVMAVAVVYTRVGRLRQRAAFALIMGLCCFVAIRAISLHDVDQLLYNRPIEGVRLSSALELGLVMSLAAVAGLGRRRPPRDATRTGIRPTGSAGEPASRG